VKRPPEIIQTSAMDCGPAALAALLGAHGLPASVDGLRGLCATDVDGTSIDDLEVIAARLGLEAEQVVVPLGQVLAAPELYLPAILLTRAPDGYLHFVVAWRVRRGRVDLVDPGIGRRRVRVADLHAEALRHEILATEAEWAEYALGEDARIALAARLNGSVGRLETAVANGAVDGVGALLNELEPEPDPVVERAGGDEVLVRGAVLVRAPRRREMEPGEELPDVLTPTRSPTRALLELLAGARGRVAAALLFAALAGLAAVGELLAARPMLESGATAGRVLTLAAAVAVALVTLTISVALALSAGRRIEHRLRERLLARLPRLGDHYVRSRPPGDMAERGHAISLIRQLVELGSLGMQRLVEAVAAAVAIVVIAPSAWPAALVVALLALVVPGWLARWLAEPDLRARSAQGAVSLQLTDALGAADVLRPLSAVPVLPALRAPLLALWARAAGVAQARLAGALLVVALGGLMAAGLATALAVGAGEPAATAVTAAVLAFAATIAAQDVAFVARRLVPLRNAMARVLEPLDVTLPDPEPAGHDPGGPPAAVALENVTVRLGPSAVLDGVSVAIGAGEHVAVVGASGAGKSSLVAVLAGWLDASEGRVLVDGRPLQGETLAALRRATAWADTATRVLDDSLRANADYGAAAGAPAAAERLRAVGLRGDPDSSPGDLSRADRQRLLLARALGRPQARLVLLDEAAGEIEQDERRALLRRLRTTWEQSTLINVTHDVAGALEFPRVLVVEHGQIVEDGPPDHLAADPDTRFRALLDAQQRLAARLRERAPSRSAAFWAGGRPGPADAPWAEPGDPARASRITPTGKSAAEGSSDGPDGAPESRSSAGADRNRGRWTSLVRERAIAGPVALALLASALATVLLVFAGERLDSGARSGEADQLGWLAGTLALLALTALLLTAGSLALGRAAVGLGLSLRRRALNGATNVRLAAESVGRRVGLALDLELLEATALGAGATLAFAGTEALMALTLLVLADQVASAGALLAALVALAALALPLRHRGTAAVGVRAAATEHLVERLLALRTVTIQEDPAAEREQRTRLLDALERAHARVDRLRVALAAVLPRTAVLAMLVPLVLDPPAEATTAAGTLGAILLAYGALERLGVALAELTPAIASARAAGALLDQPPPADAAPAMHVPVPRPEHVLHQTLAVNALLARPEWPPAPETVEAMERRLAAVDLAPLVERMPMGFGQPLGQTGWRLSQGERARLVLVRGLMAEPQTLVAEDPLGALDPGTAERVLDALDAETVPVTVR
jgi:ATP-binding cassette subfamily B protein